LVDLLLDRRWITDADRAEVERLLDRKLRNRNGDSRAGLRDALDPIARDALAQVDHPEIAQSMDGLEVGADAPSRPPLASFTPTIDYLPMATRFQMLKHHASGGLGQVWLAHDRDLNRDVALKRIRRERVHHEEARRRFIKEAQITGQLEHPNIVPVYELGRITGGDEPFYAMKMVHGRTLKDAIADYCSEHEGTTSAKSPSEARRKLLTALVQVGQAMAYAHSRGVLHCDLKPENVILGPFGEIIVLDWGLARLRGQPAQDRESNPVSPSDSNHVRLVQDALGPETTAGRVQGSLAYMSPEQAAGKTEVFDERVDVYGLGAILFEILTGRTPHQGKERPETLESIIQGPTPLVTEVAPEAPQPLAELAARAMAHDPAHRLASASAFVAELESWLADEPVAAYRALVEGFERLALEHPEVTPYQEEVARCQLTLGLILDGVGRLDQAHTCFQKAIALYERLVSTPQTTAGHRADLAAARTHLARVLQARGETIAAEDARRAARADYEALRSSEPAAQDYTSGLEEIYMTLTLEPRAERGGSRVPDHTLGLAESGGPDSSVELEPAPSSHDEPVAWGETEAATESIRELRRERLTILHTIGSGGLGRVYAAQDNDLNRVIAVKQLADHALRDLNSLKRFLREAQITAQLEHPNIIPIYGLGHRAESGAPFLMMRLVTGRTLHDAIRRYHRHRSEGEATTVELKNLLFACVKVAFALDYAHARGVVHRDAKPANVLLGPYGEVLLVDWGLALVQKARDGVRIPGGVVLSPEIADHDFAPGSIVGTPVYMAPELALGHATDADSRTDIYSLGVTLFEILTGTRPFKGQNARELLEAIKSAQHVPLAREIDGEIPRPLDAIAAKAMARDPAERYATAGAFGRDIQSWLIGEKLSFDRDAATPSPAP
jgi:serine/threonine protein kinase